MDAIKYQQQFYDKRWKGFQFANRLKLARCIAILERIYWTRIKEPRIIDLGCGAGWLTGILGTFGPTTGVDLSGEAVRVGRERYPHVRFIQCNIFDWNYPKGIFDIVVSQEVIEHVEDQDRYVAIAYDLLRDGGYLILTTPNAETFYAMPNQQRISWSNQPIEKWLTIGEVKKLLTKYFDIVRVDTIILGFGSKGLYRYMNSRRLDSFLRKMGVGEIWDKMRGKMGFGLHIVAMAQKVSHERLLD